MMGWRWRGCKGQATYFSAVECLRALSIGVQKRCAHKNGHHLVQSGWRSGSVMCPYPLGHMIETFLRCFGHTCATLVPAPGGPAVVNPAHRFIQEGANPLPAALAMTSVVRASSTDLQARCQPTCPGLLIQQTSHFWCRRCHGCASRVEDGECSGTREA
jgi:hypothetical protein